MRNNVQAAMTADRMRVSLDFFLLIDPVNDLNKLYSNDFKYHFNEKQKSKRKIPISPRTMGNLSLSCLTFP